MSTASNYPPIPLLAMSKHGAVLPIFCAALLISCGEGSGAMGNSSSDLGGASSGSLDPQVPPADKELMAAWLQAFQEEGWEAEWACEASATPKTAGASSIHAHGGSNRVCNNARLATAVVDVSNPELPLGSAALKFVNSGIYVEVKVAERSDSGNGWFWYSPGGSTAGTGVSLCVNCHQAAGSDADHPGLGDYVYFQVR